MKFSRGSDRNRRMADDFCIFLQGTSVFLFPTIPGKVFMSFLTSFAVIILSALLLGSFFRRLHLPQLIGMLLAGMIIGPYVLDLITPELLSVSADLRKFALIVILTRAGLSLDISDLKKVERPAVLLCFIPATFEIIGYTLFARLFLGLTYAEGALMGTVMAAVSPAVVVPRMLKIQENGYGINKCIPQMITAGASCDDVFVIVLFTAFLGINQTDTFSFAVLADIPVSVILGITAGLIIGWLFSLFFSRVRVRDTSKILIFLSVSFLLTALENLLSGHLPFSGLLSVISFCVMFRFRDKVRAEKLSARFEKIWVFAEIILFVLVGAQVDVSYALTSGWRFLPVMLLSLVFRTAGVAVCLIGTGLDLREKLFCAIAYIPKATVQAAIGGIALAAGLTCGKAVLTCAVLSILITAPAGALAIDVSYGKLLKHEVPVPHNPK